MSIKEFAIIVAIYTIFSVVDAFLVASFEFPKSSNEYNLLFSYIIMLLIRGDQVRKES